jgi:hypothetical protein
MQFFCWKPVGKNPTGGPKHRYENNIIIDRKVRGGGYELDSSGSEMGSLAGFCEHCIEHLGSMKSSRFLVYLFYFRNCP